MCEEERHNVNVRTVAAAFLSSEELETRSLENTFSRPFDGRTAPADVESRLKNARFKKHCHSLIAEF